MIRLPDGTYHDSSTATYVVVVGQTLAQLRTLRGRSQKDLARQLSALQSVVSRTETGRLPLTIEMLARWSAALQVQPHEVLRLVDDAIVRLKLYGISVAIRRPAREDVSAATISALLCLALPLTASSSRASRASRAKRARIA